MDKLLKNKKVLTIGIGIAVGLLGGFLYWKFIGCTSGTCPITSNWHTTTLFGGVFGYLIGDTIYERISKSKEKKVEETE